MKKSTLLILSTVTLSLAAFASAADTSVTSTGVTAGNTTVSNSGSVSTTSNDLDSLDLDSLGAELDSTGTTSAASTGLSWGYTSGDLVVVKGFSGDVLLIDAPAVKDGAGKLIKRYKVSYSTSSVAETMPTNLQQSTFNFDEITGSTVTLELTGLSSTGTYYFVVEPMNKDNNAGTASSEVSYDPAHGAAMSGSTATGSNQLSDVTYSYSGMDVTLKWTPVEGATKVEVYFKTEDQEEYTKVGDAKMSDGSFNFALTKTGNAYVKLIPTDDNGAPVGAEIVKALKVDTTVTPEVKKAPKVGPETDAILALIALSIVGYGIYRYRKIA